MLKPDEQKKNNFFYNLFFRNQKNFFLPFLLIFLALDPHPWIRIFLQIEDPIQEDKMLRIHWIQILSTA